MPINLRQEFGPMSPDQSPTEGMEQQPPKKKWWLRIIVGLIVIAAVVFSALFLLSYLTDFNVLGLNKGGVAKSDWHAVFLANGEVYFGQLKNLDADYPKLEDIYYLRVEQVLQEGAQPEGQLTPDQEQQQTQQRLTLVKFGNELHKPLDFMRINRDQILYLEQLADDSAVVKAIREYKGQ